MAAVMGGSFCYVTVQDCAAQGELTEAHPLELFGKLGFVEVIETR